MMNPTKMRMILIIYSEYKMAIAVTLISSTGIARYTCHVDRDFNVLIVKYIVTKESITCPSYFV